uniref:Uncharacterized protein n=1 Tax=Branchiostoma floridae TaxID=7739 RepID=C3YY47_BRAFL|eukprot:XP_002598994.1 hypothetical protein BRAFLDRAFT_79927 [Branchiostoma floridae]
MESDFARETSGRRCKVCRLPVRGHPGPYGRGKCKFERREGSSDEEYFKQQRGSSHVEEKLQSLRRESKVSDLVRAAWSDSISEDTDETQVRQSRSLNLKKSSGRSRENASTRARSEPPVQFSRHRTRSSSSEATAARDKAKPDIRDLRKSRGLVKEVDKALDELLNPDISHGKQPRSKRYQDRGSVSSSSQSDSTESDFVREPARRRQRRRGSRGKMKGKHVSSKRPVSRRRCDSYDSDTSSGMADDSRSRSTKRRRRRAGKSGKMKGKHVSSKRSVSRRRCDSSDSDTSSGMSDDSRSRSTKRRRRRAGKSGRKRTINDSGTRRVKVDWPQHRVHFPGHGKEGGVTYDQLSLPMFVHGFLKNVLYSERVSVDAEHKLVHLADLMFDAVYYNWELVREVHASLLYGIEYGSLTWGSRGTFDAVRERHYRTQAGVARGNPSSLKAGPVREARAAGSRPRYCGGFQYGSCSLQSGHWSSRWNAPMLHVCSACLIVRGIQEPHSSQDCQYKPRPFLGSTGDTAHLSQRPGPSRGRSQSDQVT